MRNKYSEEFNNFLEEQAKNYNISELIEISKEKFGYEISKKAMCKLLYRRKLRHRDYNEKLATSPSEKKPIGTEWLRKDGMVLIKIGEPSVWTYKQRYIYEKHHGKLPKGYKVIFLDQDRTNFDINNLMAVPASDALVAHNLKVLSSDADVTKTGLMIAGIYNKVKEIKKGGNK